MIGNRIKIMRMSKGVKQEDLAEYLGVSTGTMSKYENNKGDISFLSVVKIAKYLRCTMSELLGEQEKTTETFDKKNFVFIPIIKLTYIKHRIPQPSITEDIIGEFAIDTSKINIPDDIEPKIVIMEGDSMAPKYKDGDYALYIHTDDYLTGDIIIVLFDGKFYIRGYFPNIDGTITLKPYSKDSVEIHTSSQDNRYRPIGKVLHVFRTIKNANFYD